LFRVVEPGATADNELPAAFQAIEAAVTAFLREAEQGKDDMMIDKARREQTKNKHNNTPFKYVCGEKQYDSHGNMRSLQLNFEVNA
jgi:hypothetical protein